MPQSDCEFASASRHAGSAIYKFRVDRSVSADLFKVAILIKIVAPQWRA